MTIGDAIFEILLQLQQQEVSVTVSRPTVKMYLNEALQFTRRIAEQSDYLYYAKSKTFTSTATITYEADFKGMIFIHVPAATDGQARIASNRQYVTINNNSYETGTIANPVARLQSANWIITPASTGTYYYLSMFGVVDDETANLTDYVPWVYEEMVILKTVELLMLRHFMLAEPQTKQLEQSLATAENAYKALYRKWMPETSYREEQPSPAINITIGQQT